METALSSAFKKLFPESFDSEYYIEALLARPEGEWFAPTNEDDSYNRIDQMAAMHLVCKRTSPLWSNGSFRGQRVEFMYRLDLNYKNL